MPEFTIDHTENLKTLLERKGIENIFTDSADFSPMAANTPLKIDSITHKAHIEVDRRGTKAAVVTYSYVVAAGAPMMDEYKSVVLDRPFVYAIMHKKTGLPLFIGTVQNL
jgi:Serine protease inhibitor